jgi:hypothetical protein
MKSAAPATQPKRQTKPLSRTALGCLTVLVLILIGKFLPSKGSGSPSSHAGSVTSPPSDSVEVQGVRTSSAEVEKAVEDMRSLHLITATSKNNNEFQVNRPLWDVMPLNAKKGFTLTCAQYWQLHGESRLCTVVDDMTGQKLATHDSWNGVKIGGN